MIKIEVVGLEMNWRKVTMFNQQISAGANNKGTENFLRVVEFRYPQCEFYNVVDVVRVSLFLKVVKRIKENANQNTN